MGKRMSTGSPRKATEKEFIKKEVRIEEYVAEEYREAMIEFINEPIQGLSREELQQLVEDYQFLFEKLLE